MDNDRMFNVWFTICGIAGLAITGVIIWAIIVLVNHFAG